MIRLIDVALIILLGFIAISRLKTEYIALPSGSGKEAPEKTPHASIVHVYPDNFRVEDGGHKWNCPTVNQLESLLIDQKFNYDRNHEKLIVQIEPHRAAVMQTLIDVLDLCERNQIEKNLNYESIH